LRERDPQRPTCADGTQIHRGVGPLLTARRHLDRSLRELRPARHAYAALAEERFARTRAMRGTGGR
jgi:hypothetical protein